MKPDKKERYVRWQNYRITQLSFSINLFLTFAVASLAYVINIKLAQHAYDKEILSLIIQCWSWSAIFGVIATITRLLDFRYTAKKIKFGGGFNSFMAKWSGSFTWGMFWGQLITYTVGAYFFIACAINT